ncbi:MAG: hypothetical protein K9N62_07855 [Verrucomicrobia bacterium]|nr:hypothetical protein [Verrucomicrobiota bacterium]
MRYNPFKRQSDSGPAPSVIDQPKPTAKRRGRSLKPKRTKRQPIDAAEALQRATVNTSMANYPAIFEGFTAKGIPESEILPRENVFTFDAWRAMGRTVRRGEHGVKVATVIVVSGKKNQDDTPAEAPAEEGAGSEAPGRMSRRGRATVFHISQTDPLAPRSGAPAATPAARAAPAPQSPAPAAAPAPTPKAPAPPSTVIAVAFRSVEPPTAIPLLPPAPAPAAAPAKAVAPWRAAWLAKRKGGA